MHRGGVSRLAPSPSGPLHLGNACTFLINWALARRLGWRLLLRIEDLDAPRVRAGAESEIRRSLAWLGIDFDDEAPRQSARGGAYERAMRSLAAQRLVFESRHSRAQVRTAVGGASTPRGGSRDAAGRDDDDHPASAPHGAALAFPASLRPADESAWRFTDRSVNHRLAVPDRTLRIDDAVLGPRSVDLRRDMGDCLVWSKAGTAAYQLAVTVDDGEQGVTEVVRGEDLLPSAGVQSLLHASLGRAPPRWWHLPLVVDADGRRLSKREGDRSLQALRDAGVPAARVIGLVAWWSGLVPALAPLDPGALVRACDPARLREWPARGPARLDDAIDAWLIGRDDDAPPRRRASPSHPPRD